MIEFLITFEHPVNVALHWFRIHSGEVKAKALYASAKPNSKTISSTCTMNVLVPGDFVDVEMFAVGTSNNMITYNVSIGDKKLFKKDVEVIIKNGIAHNHKKDVAV